MDGKFIEQVANFQGVETSDIINEIKNDDFALKIFDGFVVDTYKDAALGILPDAPRKLSISLDPLTDVTTNIRVIHTTLGLGDDHRNIFYIFDSTESDTASIGAYANGAFWYKDIEGGFLESTFDKLHELVENNKIAASGFTSDGGRFCLKTGFIQPA